jgi:hypothetical protein
MELFLLLYFSDREDALLQMREAELGSISSGVVLSQRSHLLVTYSYSGMGWDGMALLCW